MSEIVSVSVALLATGAMVYMIGLVIRNGK